MLYLATCPNEVNVAAALRQRRIGLMCQPQSNLPTAGLIWAADNGCFAKKWDEKKWRNWLVGRPRAGCLFATVPDVVGDAEATNKRFDVYAESVRDLRYPVAYVAQDGLENLTPPWDEFDCLFIGGSTEWKLGPHAFALAVEGRKRGKWVHVGRINSFKRYALWAPFADSTDGTFLSYGPTKNIVRLLGWLDRYEGSHKVLSGPVRPVLKDWEQLALEYT